jgi:hypothetical protein
VIGKRVRVKTDGTRIFKLHLKEEDKKLAEERSAAMALVYKKLTNKIITLEFVKPQLEEKKKKQKKKEGKKEGRKEGGRGRRDRERTKEKPKEEAEKAAA